MEAKRGLVIFVFIVILLAFFVQFTEKGGFSITGFAPTGTFAPSIVVTNAAPVIGNVSINISGQLTLNENTFRPVLVSFVASDGNGASDLTVGGGGAWVNITNNGTTSAMRRNDTCTSANINDYSINISCTVDLWYFDIAGPWNISAAINDTNGTRNLNTTGNFTIADTLAVAIQSALTFTSASPNTFNTTASTSVRVNNTGNHNSTSLTTGHVNVTAVNLRGENNPNYTIPAANFTVRNATSGGADPLECLNYYNGTQHFLKNNTSLNITNATLAPGNRTASEGVEDVYFCIYHLPVNLTAQTYSASGVNAWTITIS